jgi:hypothetical protein
MLKKALLSVVLAVILPATGLTSQLVPIAQHLRDGLVHLAKKEPGRDFREPGVHIRSTPDTRAVVAGLGNPGDSVTVHRSVPGESVVCPDGRANSEWFDVIDRRTSVAGFVSGCFL